MSPRTQKTPPSLPAPETQSESFKANREARRKVLIEDYVELISDLLAEAQEARQVDIAARLGVSQPTVAKMVVRLVADGLVVQKSYRGIFLTEAGENLAEQARVRHRIVESFLRALGVSEECVLVDAEGIEHYVSDETLATFQKALNGGLAKFMKRL